jgi:D-arabinose 1-dehydrogenase-like Zn-dependent alcohol dehydrogenase
MTLPNCAFPNVVDLKSTVSLVLDWVTDYQMLHHAVHIKPVRRSLFMVSSGKISVPIKTTFRLAEIQKAHREYASSSRMGSIVIEIRR